MKNIVISLYIVLYLFFTACSEQPSISSSQTSHFPCDNKENCLKSIEQLEAQNDIARLTHFLGKACQYGDGNSCYKLASNIVKAKNDEEIPKILELVEKACDLEHNPGCMVLGDLYIEGESLKQDILKARGFYSKACDLGNKEGCHKKMEIDCEGENTTIGSVACVFLADYAIDIGDFVKAAQYYMKACYLSSFTCSGLAALYKVGIGVKQDLQKALELYTKACDAENANSCLMVGFAYGRDFHEFGIKQNTTKAKGLYAKACDLDNADACMLLGSIMDDEKQYAKSVKFYTKGCYLDKPSYSACGFLASMYQYGVGVKQDFFRAVELFNKSCSGGVSVACEMLGNLYIEGKGVRQDLYKAKQLYGRACDLGEQLGCDKYKILNENF